MTANERFKEAIDWLVQNKIVRNQQEFVEKIDSDKSTVSQVKNGHIHPTNDLFVKTNKAFPHISLEYLERGVGSLLNKESDYDKRLKDIQPNYINESHEKYLVSSLSNNNELKNKYLTSLLPLSARTNHVTTEYLNTNFSKFNIIESPIEHADFATILSDDRLGEEYPDGSLVYFRHANHKLYLEWGKVYAVSTENGIIIKRIEPGKKENCIKCISNFDFPFEIDLETTNVNLFKAVACVTIK